MSIYMTKEGLLFRAQPWNRTRNGRDVLRGVVCGMLRGEQDAKTVLEHPAGPAVGFVTLVIADLITQVRARLGRFYEPAISDRYLGRDRVPGCTLEALNRWTYDPFGRPHTFDHRWWRLRFFEARSLILPAYLDYSAPSPEAVQIAWGIRSWALTPGLDGRVYAAMQRCEDANPIWNLALRLQALGDRVGRCGSESIRTCALKKLDIPRLQFSDPMEWGMQVHTEFTGVRRVTIWREDGCKVDLDTFKATVGERSDDPSWLFAILADIEDNT